MSPERERLSWIETLHSVGHESASYKEESKQLAERVRRLA